MSVCAGGARCRCSLPHTQVLPVYSVSGANAWWDACVARAGGHRETAVGRSCVTVMSPNRIPQHGARVVNRLVSGAATARAASCCCDVRGGACLFRAPRCVSRGLALGDPLQLLPLCARVGTLCAGHGLCVHADGAILFVSCTRVDVVLCVRVRRRRSPE